MYRFYKDAAACYVTLVDLPPRSRLKDTLQNCRWFTRGWTLQELIAPSLVEFYDSAWTYVGSRFSLRDEISHITSISVEVLMDGGASSVATKMSWAAKRHTKRIEYRAYCMLGIFDVNMPLIYGEHRKAFIRLQEEIIKRNNDLTLLAWNCRPDRYGRREKLISPLAPTPAVFSDFSRVSKITAEFPEFSVTNKGLLISGDSLLHSCEIKTAGGEWLTLYVLKLGTTKSTLGNDKHGGIFLRKIAPHVFCRDGLLPLAGFRSNSNLLHAWEVSEFYILLDTEPAHQAALTSRRGGIHIPFDTYLAVKHTYPETLWDHAHRMFLQPKYWGWRDYQMVLIMIFELALDHAGGDFPLAVLGRYIGDKPFLKIFSFQGNPREFERISQARFRQEGIHVQELDLQAPSVRDMANSTWLDHEGRSINISVSLMPGTMDFFGTAFGVNVLSFAIDGKQTRSIPGSDAGQV